MVCYDLLKLTSIRYDMLTRGHARSTVSRAEWVEDEAVCLGSQSSDLTRHAQEISSTAERGGGVLLNIPRHG